MKTKKFKSIVIGSFWLLILFLFSCSKDQIKEIDTAEIVSKSNNESMLKAGAIDLPGRVLASNCFQCHGTNGYAGELKIGEQSASSIISDLNEMKSKDPRANIMNVHAQAYTKEEIQLIANYISKQIKY
jgi:sulfide dehydrogenase cytochrome subunit